MLPTAPAAENLLAYIDPNSGFILWQMIAAGTIGVLGYFHRPIVRFLRLLETGAPRSTILVRLVVGGTFLSEGIQKFVVPALGAARFVKIGIPFPGFTAPFVGVFEIVCGSLLIVGLLTRLAAIPMIVNISVAIVSTKIPILLGGGFWIFNAPEGDVRGFWTMLHEGRTDFAMLLGSIFLLIVGAGGWSIDARLAGSCRDIDAT